MIPIPRKSLLLLALVAILALVTVLWFRQAEAAKERERILKVQAAFDWDFGRCRSFSGSLGDTLMDRIRRSDDRPVLARWLDSLVRTDPDKDRQQLAMNLLGTSLLGNPQADMLLDSLSALRTDSDWRRDVELARMCAGTARGLRALVQYGDSVGTRDWPGFFWILGDLDTQARALEDRIDRGLAGRERNGFIRSLGWTRDTFWRARLEDALRDPTNWVCQASAAEALGEIQDLRSASLLQSAADSHWQPQVRMAARGALERLVKRDSTALPDMHADLYLHGLFLIEEASLRPSPVLDTLFPLPACATLDSKELRKLSWGAVLHGWSDRPTTKTIRQSPEISCAWGRGWLLGVSRGEWGGELAWLDSGRVAVLDSTPVDTFLSTRFGILTLSAGGHFGAVGHLDRIVAGPEGLPVRVPFLLLPGSGCQWGSTREGGLVFRCSHGEVFLDSTGRPHPWPPLEKRSA